MAGKKIPQRQCVGCREMKDKKAMIRVVRSGEGTFFIDATRRIPVSHGGMSEESDSE